MENVLLVAYLLIVLALIAVILLQRSEGGGLGMGGNAGGLMTVRGSANLLTRTTAILATLFFVTAIGLTIMAEFNRGTDSILDNAATSPDGTAPATVLDALSQLQGDTTLPLPAEATTTTTSSAPAAAADTNVSAEAAPTDPGLAVPVTPAAPSDAASSSAAPSSAPAQ